MTPVQSRSRYRRMVWFNDRFTVMLSELSDSPANEIEILPHCSCAPRTAVIYRRPFESSFCDAGSECELRQTN
jgi:hypothetical protein